MIYMFYCIIVCCHFVTKKPNFIYFLNILFNHENTRKDEFCLLTLILILESVVKDAFSNMWFITFSFMASTL